MLNMVRSDGIGICPPVHIMGNRRGSRDHSKLLFVRDVPVFVVAFCQGGYTNFLKGLTLSLGVKANERQ